VTAAEWDSQTEAAARGRLHATTTLWTHSLALT